MASRDPELAGALVRVKRLWRSPQRWRLIKAIELVEMFTTEACDATRAGDAQVSAKVKVIPLNRPARPGGA